jgi:hypothetical protein
MLEEDILLQYFGERRSSKDLGPCCLFQLHLYRNKSESSGGAGQNLIYRQLILGAALTTLPLIQY